ncbi:hypothetical protein CVT24_007592 [Panaeolus cyanescens]|uniref:BTB domain-containing protein n=1 Tax=Panaeolus cyanescens TaxID=181874 RepID=A0A409YKK3_9AGAR|nr:hypothetical protein CVT24_007592 [Panaeolus cyanescens]
MAPFAQRAKPVATLKSVLAGYPFSIGIFHEIISNSEDAGATKQVFVLDRRTHDTEGLYHDKLIRAQGPALLAFNDAKFTDDDWEALQAMHESSKASDLSKIGKFGLGFRSVFHLTDCPQIISGESFVVFDPSKSFTDCEGQQIEIASLITNHPGQLSPFQYFLEQGFLQGATFNGTVIRCPLRAVKDGVNNIGNETVSPDRLHRLLTEFSKNSLELSLLFLKSLKEVTIIDIDESGSSQTLASLSFERSPQTPVSNLDDCFFHSVISSAFTAGASSTTQSWNVISCPFSREQAINVLAEKMDEDVDLNPILQEHKFQPSISIATLSNMTKTRGRFFTYLPLPLFSSFGIHINANFALTESRQQLLNSNDSGIARNSVDHIRREWNKAIFDVFIPRTWKSFLQFVSQQPQVTTQALFDSWPNTIASHDWKNVPFRVFESVVASETVIWPLLGDSGVRPVFKSLQDVLVAKQTEKRVAEALASMGLDIVIPPAYIFDFISRSSHSSDIKLLSPERAHDALLRRTDRFQAASLETLRGVLEYLVSTSNCLNLVGLPIIPVSNSSGLRLSLETLQQSGEIYTLLDSAQSRIFSACDNRSISLTSLPHRTGAVLLEKGPGVLNVKTLVNTQIVQYVKQYLDRLDSDIANISPKHEILTWLSAFWEWFATWKDKKDLRQLLEKDETTLIPCTTGLKPLTSSVFKARGMQPLIIRQLSAIGIFFVHSDLSPGAHEQLASMNILKQISNIHELLDALPPSDSITQPPPEMCMGILRHFSAYSSASCNKLGDFSAPQLERLKSLPIYPIFERPGVRTFSSIPTGSTARLVRRPSFLPVINDVIFVELDLIGIPLSSLVTTSADRMDDNSLLSLTCDHFLEQTPELQASVLEYLMKNQRIVSLQIREQLADIAFVVTESGSRAKPGDIVDPESEIACLFPNEPSVRPQLETEPQRSITECLRKLSFLKSSLTPALIAERATHISNNVSSDYALPLAKDLLRVMCSVQYIDLSTLPQEVLYMNWLPTNRGLQSPNQTRAHRADVPSRLFDRVLAVLDQSFDISPYLRKRFGWEEPLTFDILVEQLGLVLDSADPDAEGKDIHDVVSDILKELSDLPEAFETERLEDILDERCWVPTMGGKLVTVHVAFFEVLPANLGFAPINCRRNTNLERLLRHLGCVDSPTVASILLRMNALKGEEPSSDIVDGMVTLLNCLPNGMSQSELDGVLVPDTNSILQPLAQIYYNDIGNNATFFPNHGPIAHRQITSNIAQKLGMPSLGLQLNDLDILSIQMGADPLVQVQNVLKDYTSGQFITEFVANAVDAGATSFKLFVSEGNRVLNDSPQALFSSMNGFTQSPSLIVYNNSLFKEKDFKGICETSVGGKGDRTDTIGQFGRGAATMFYFTEVAVIVSGHHVLFLNPSGKHLPGQRTALRLPLHHVKRCYPDDLRPANGVFGFSVDAEDDGYNGTLFILPLRTATHLDLGAHDRWAHQSIWDSQTISQKVITPFETSAANCLLFTPLSTISAVRHWEFTAQHENVETPEEGTGYCIRDVQIAAGNSLNLSKWRVASTTVLQIPSDIKQPKFIRDPVAGLAARLSDEHSSHPKQGHSFFSTLPLQIPTSVPVHVMASFVLSSDRRNIRLDEYDNVETAYNRWLLRDVLPPLYLYLLEKLAMDANIPSSKLRKWWPGHRDVMDNISRSLIKSFYGVHLKESLRHVFIGEFDTHTPNAPRQPFSPNEVYLTGEEPPYVHKVLVRLQSRRLVKLSDGALKRALDEAKLSGVDRAFLRDEIMDKLQNFRSLFSLSSDAHDTEEDALTIRDLENVIVYLNGRGDTPSQEPVESALEGMPILPLANIDMMEFGTFTFDSSREPYFSMPNVSNQVHRVPHNFPSSKFIHPGLHHKTMLRLGANIKAPTAEQLVALIEETIQARPVLENPPDDLIEWTFAGERGFWNLFRGYKQLGLTSDHIQSFPLVPTVQTHIFVSLNTCKDGPTLLFNPSAFDASDSQLLDAFRQLEINVVDPDSPTMPPNLRDILQTSDYTAIDPLIRVLKAFEGKPAEMINAEFNDVDGDAWSRLAEWMQQSIDRSSMFKYNTLPEDSPLLQAARRLPIWPSASQEERNIRWSSADEIHLLPSEIQLVHALPFIPHRISDHPVLHRLRGLRYEYADIPGILFLPDHLEDAALGQYRSFLGSWLYHLPLTDRPASIQVPNTTGHMRDCSTLYARSPLFIAAYGDESDVFVSPVFSDLENKLGSFGLKTEDHLDMEIFRECVNVIDHAEDNHERVGRASRIFNAYCEQISMIALQRDDGLDLLRQFDDYSFIPRKMRRHRRLPGMAIESGLEIVHVPTHPQELARVLSPKDMVKEEYEAVAWSQRAGFETQPSQRILSVYPTLGKPTFAEVVLHLEYLSSLTPHSDDDRRIIAHDAKASYGFLMKNLPLTDDEANDIENIIPYNIDEKAIFLNINDEGDEAWTWLRGSQLVFNASDGDGLFSVKAFLKDFQTLLSRSGAYSVHRPSVERSVIAAPEGHLRVFKEKFDGYRRSNKFVDVVFEAQAEEGGEILKFWAHRSFLSISSAHFTDVFVDGGLCETRNDACEVSPVVLPREGSDNRVPYRPCIEQILDYIYSPTGLLPDGLSLETLLGMFELAEEWALDELSKLIQEDIINNNMIEPHTVDEIEQIAKQHKVALLEEKCIEFKEKNQAYIDRALSLADEGT